MTLTLQKATNNLIFSNKISYKHITSKALIKSWIFYSERKSIVRHQKVEDLETTMICQCCASAMWVHLTFFSEDINFSLHQTIELSTRQLWILHQLLSDLMDSSMQESAQKDNHLSCQWASIPYALRLFITNWVTVLIARELKITFFWKKNTFQCRLRMFVYKYSHS